MTTRAPRLAFLLGAMLCAGGFASLAGQKPVPVPAVIAPDREDLPTATANRVLVEQQLAAGRCDLPAGTVHVDRAVRVPSGATLTGKGLTRTTLRNSHTHSPYGDNCTLALHGDGAGYVDGCTPGANAVTLVPAADVSKYPPGTVVYVWRWFTGAPWPDADGTCCQRREVARVDVRTRTLTLAGGPVDRRINAIKWVSGVPAGDVAEGEAVLTCDRPQTFDPGDPVYVTSGPSVANECRGEYRTVLAAGPDGLTLDRPLRQTYAGAAALRVRPVRDAVVADLTVAAPANPAAEAALLKWAAGVRLERVRFAGPRGLAAAACGRLTLADCEAPSPGGVALNTCHDVLLRGGRVGTLYGEECAFDVLADGLLVASPAVNGVATNTQCERWTLRGVRVEGAGNMPVVLEGRECVVDGCVIAATRGVMTNAYVGGDRSRVSGLVSDVPVIVRDGLGQSAAHVRAPWVGLGWIDGRPSRGAAVDVSNPVQFTKWSVWP